MCVPLCVVGVLLVAQPTGLFGGSSASTIGATGLTVGITQVCATDLYDSCACVCRCKSIPSVSCSCLMACRQLLQLAIRCASAT